LNSKKEAKIGAGHTGLENDDEAIVRTALHLGASDAKLITSDQVILGNWVRAKCHYGCPYFGKTLTCPPFTPSIDEVRNILSEYEKILLMRFEQIPITENPNENEFVKEFEKRQTEANDATLNIEKQLLLKGYYKVFALEPGRCNRCSDCANETGKCRFPLQARPAPESFAIDMFKTVENAGWCLEVKTKLSQSWTNYALVLIE
jgi:predicted metal-binding protein